MNNLLHVKQQVYVHDVATAMAYSDDQQYVIMLFSLCGMLSILHGLVQYWGEISRPVELHLANSVVICIQYPLAIVGYLTLHYIYFYKPFIVLHTVYFKCLRWKSFAVFTDQSVIAKLFQWNSLYNRPWPYKTTVQPQMFSSELQFSFTTVKLFRFAIYSSYKEYVLKKNFVPV